jgi:hypothetical protein
LEEKTHKKTHTQTILELFKMKILTFLFFLVCVVLFVNAIPKGGKKATNEVDTTSGGNQGGGSKTGTQVEGGGGKPAKQAAAPAGPTPTNASKGKKKKGKKKTKPKDPVIS